MAWIRLIYSWLWATINSFDLGTLWTSNDFWHQCALWYTALKSRLLVRGDRERILEWAASKMPTVKPPQNYTTDWKDGLALCALMETLSPGTCPRFDLLNPDHANSNVQMALRIIEKFLKTKTSLTVDELLECKGDQKLHCLLAQLRMTSSRKGIIPSSESNPPSAQQKGERSFGSDPECAAKGMGLMLAVKGRKATFNIYLKTTTSLNIVVEIRGPNGTLASERITGRSPKRRQPDKPGDTKIPFEYEVHLGRVSVGYIPQATGKHRLSIIWQGQHIVGSPYVVSVDESIDMDSYDPGRATPPRVLSKMQDDRAPSPQIRPPFRKLGGVTRRRVLRHIVLVEGQEVVVESPEELARAVQRHPELPDKSGVKILQEQEETRKTLSRQNSVDLENRDKNLRDNERKDCKVKEIKEQKLEDIDEPQEIQQSEPNLIQIEQEITSFKSKEENEPIKEPVSETNEKDNENKENVIETKEEDSEIKLKGQLNETENEQDNDGNSITEEEDVDALFDETLLPAIEIEKPEQRADLIWPCHSTSQSFDHHSTFPTTNLQDEDDYNQELSFRQSSHRLSLPNFSSSMFNYFMETTSSRSALELREEENEEQITEAVEVVPKEDEGPSEELLDLFDTPRLSYDKSMVAFQLPNFTQQENDSSLNSDPDSYEQQKVQTETSEELNSEVNDLASFLDQQQVETNINGELNLEENDLTSYEREPNSRNAELSSEENDEITNEPNLSSEENENFFDAAYLSPEKRYSFDEPPTQPETRRSSQDEPDEWLIVSSEKDEHRVTMSGRRKDILTFEARNPEDNSTVISRKLFFENLLSQSETSPKKIPESPSKGNASNEFLRMKLFWEKSVEEERALIEAERLQNEAEKNNEVFRRAHSPIKKTRSDGRPESEDSGVFLTSSIGSRNWAPSNHNPLFSLDDPDQSFSDDRFIDDEIPDYAALTMGRYVSFTGLLEGDTLFSRQEIMGLQNPSSLQNQVDNPELTLLPKPDCCRAYGAGVYYGQVGMRNRFQVITAGGGRGCLTVSVQGPGQHDVMEVVLAYVGQDSYDIMYEVSQPGYYIISVKWSEWNIPHSPFICKVTY